MDWVFERYQIRVNKYSQASRVLLELTATEKEYVKSKGLLHHVIYEFVDGREQRARDLDDDHGILGYLFGMLIKPESRPPRDRPVQEKAKRTITVNTLLKGYQHVGTAFEIDTFEQELSAVLENFESDLDTLINDDNKITVRRGKIKP